MPVQLMLHLQHIVALDILAFIIIISNLQLLVSVEYESVIWNYLIINYSQLSLINKYHPIKHQPTTTVSHSIVNSSAHAFTLRYHVELTKISLTIDHLSLAIIIITGATIKIMYLHNQLLQLMTIIIGMVLQSLSKLDTGGAKSGVCGLALSAQIMFQIATLSLSLLCFQFYLFLFLLEFPIIFTHYSYILYSYAITQYYCIIL